MARVRQRAPNASAGIGAPRRAAEVGDRVREALRVVRVEVRSGDANAGVVCLPFGPTLVCEFDDAGARGIGWIVYLGIAPTALGFATWSFALRRMTAGRLASLAYLIPVVAVVLGWALLDETPPQLAIVGGALCVAGVYVARRK
jgi:uncharacterized membrane protein